ncbi:helix-turn-helix domain-containing protein [Comamonas sp. GB3 AK4-5]|uniref:helix-turn-helix domain-containing protein n=1 Tax=Comamonas sp. GB3 AK4-5 TaxID=3231487 RepID=UPI00351F4E8C
MLSQRFIQDFGLAVRQLREARNWSQEQLAAQSNLNRSYVGEIERGKVAPSLVTLHKLALALLISASELLIHAEHIHTLRQSQLQHLVAIAG